MENPPRVTLQQEVHYTIEAYLDLAYTKPSVVYRMLRELVGADVFREAMKLYSERKAFQHVDVILIDTDRSNNRAEVRS